MSTQSHRARPIGLLYLLLSLVALGIGLFLAASPLQALPATTITVNSTADVVNPTDHLCTLREAIIAANTDTASGAGPGECPAGSGADYVVVPAGTFTLTIGGPTEDNSVAGDLDITQDVTISGAGSFTTTITTQGSWTNDRVFEVHSTAHAAISHLAIMGGWDNGWCGGGIRDRGNLTLTDVLFVGNYSSSGGGGLCVSLNANATLSNVIFSLNTSSNGGAIRNGGMLTLTNVALGYNAATMLGGGLENLNVATLTDSTIAINTAGSGGGGIDNIGWMTLNRVTIDHNETTNLDGGGIYSTGTMMLTNVTLSDNQANATSGRGGAIYQGNGFSVTLHNVTIYSNTASIGGGIYREPVGTPAPLVLRNTIVANSALGGNCGGAVIISQGNNLDSANTCGFSNTGDLHDQNPLLGPLADNGGASWTRALLVGSPAIDHGANAGCPSTDQRGKPRPVGLACDIGAFESQLNAFLPLILKSP